ncbi:MAG: 3,4-dihydroxy-2-butanone-4-phosphate synthase [Phycisphaeraceae bacterium]|nr:3,4-dihydroxy-2-butanone-4-phosphate synthase [Phycisphaeraceae bacterium]
MFAPIHEILDELRAGRMIVLTDDENRENEGDLVIPAQFITPAAITFMLKEAKGYLCLCLTEADCDRLDLYPQAPANTSVRGTAFTISLDLHPKFGGTTGVSAKERAACILKAIDPTTTPADFVRPGHINPLRSRDGGVLVRTGQTEGSVDLSRLAGLTPAAVLIEIMRDDGEMARLPDLELFCRTHGLKMCSVAQIIEHRLARESLVRRLPPAHGIPVETAEGRFTLYAYDSLVDPQPHLALTLGVGALDPGGRVIPTPQPTLVRMHRRNVLGDIFGDLNASPEGPTSRTLHAAMAAIQKAGAGALVYLRPQSMGDDLSRLIETVRRPHEHAIDATDPGLPGPDAIPMRQRDFGVGGQILRDLGLSKLRLLSNHARAFPGLEAFGLEIVETIPLA